MKLSDKVLIGFFGFILLYMLVAFTEIRLKGDLNRFDESSAKTESLDINTVSYLVLPDVKQRIIVNTSDDPRIELRSTSGDVFSKLKYEITGDTLVLQRFELEEHERVRIVIHMPENSLKGIKVNGAGVVVRNLNQPALSIQQSAGTVRLEGNNSLRNVNIIASEKANFEAAGFDIDQLSVQMDNSVIKVWAPVERLEGAMTNNSRLVIKSPNDIQLKRDKSSTLKLSN